MNKISSFEIGAFVEGLLYLYAGAKGLLMIESAAEGLMKFREFII
jgi:hypothetical protein